MKKENGITLIALIITIIVMLILVGVTINVALNGGLFDKAKNATIQTEIAQIQEQLVVKKAEIIADNNGNIPNDYQIETINNLDGLSQNLIDKYNSKLIISSDGTLYYTDNATASDTVYFENAGIEEYEGSPEPIVATPKAWGTSSNLIIKTPDNNMYSMENDSVSTFNTAGLSLTECYITDFGYTFSSDTMEIYNDSSVKMDLISIDTSEKYDIILNSKSPFNGGPFLIYLPNSDSWNMIGSGNGYIFVLNAALEAYSGDISGYLTQIEALNN